MLIAILLILPVFATMGAGWGHSRFGFVGWSPVGIILLVLLIMYLTGHLHIPRHW